ncbi:MAG TPA: TMEM175 family protein [Acidimicrobiales bacterium]|nr:TMEM175 family protein [Acidimicrobiales bacterium]
MTKARLEAFSDGVFAVAITLLALDLAVGGPGAKSLADQLGDKWPSYVAYVVSFFIVGITWVNHHSLFGAIAVVDRALLFLNLLLLMFIVAIPFGTATLAAYLTADKSDAHLAAALYAAILEGAGISFTLIFTWSVRDPRRRHHPLTREDVRPAVLRFGLGAILYLVAIAVAFVSPWATLAIVAAMALYYLFEQVTDPLASAAQLRRG